MGERVCEEDALGINPYGGKVTVLKYEETEGVDFGLDESPPQREEVITVSLRVVGVLITGVGDERSR